MRGDAQHDVSLYGLLASASSGEESNHRDTESTEKRKDNQTRRPSGDMKSFAGFVSRCSLCLCG